MRLTSTYPKGAPPPDLKPYGIDAVPVKRFGANQEFALYTTSTVAAAAAATGAVNAAGVSAASECGFFTAEPAYVAVEGVGWCIRGGAGWVHGMARS